MTCVFIYFSAVLMINLAAPPFYVSRKTILKWQQKQRLE